jgi:YggT family protein
MSYTVYRAIDIVITVVQYSIFARVIVSWLPISRENQLIKLLYQVTEPILAPIRTIIQKSAFGKNMMFDFSPIIAFLLLGVLRSVVGRLFLPSLF